MAKKSKVLEEIINIEEFAEKVDDIEILESDAIFVQKINENAMMIVDERVSALYCAPKWPSPALRLLLAI